MSKQGIYLVALVFAALAGVGVVVTACGSDFGPNGDASDAGASGCTLFLASPELGTVGEPVELAVILDQPPAELSSFTWSVRFLGVEQELVELSDPVDRVSFLPSEAGPYQVLVEGTVGAYSCQPATGTVNVIADGALHSDYRMRIQPQSGAPMQDVDVRVYGGANAVLPTLSLDVGTPVAGRVVSDTGEGVAAYVRARRRGTEVLTDFETFSDADGYFDLRLPDARFDLSIVPTGDSRAATLLVDQGVANLATTIALPASVTLRGHVLDAGGAPVQGANVTLLVDGARTTSAISAVDGAFAVSGPAGQLSGLAVAPPSGSGLPSLRASALLGQNIAANSDLLIRYADALVSAQVDVNLVGGAAAAGARGEWRAELASAGSIELDQVETLSGTLRVAATASAGGLLQSPLSAVSADLVVIAADGSQGLVQRSVDFAGSPSQSLTLAVRVDAALQVEANGAPIAARIVATPLDSLAPQLVVPATQASSQGLATLQLIRGGNYQLSASDSRQGSVESSLVDVQPGLGSTVMLLPGTLTASGQIEVGGGVAAGAVVSLYCAACTGAEASVARASAVTDPAGRYQLRIVDPGTNAP